MTNIYEINAGYSGTNQQEYWKIEVIAESEERAYMLAIDFLRNCGQSTHRWTDAKIKKIGQAPSEYISKKYYRGGQHA